MTNLFLGDLKRQNYSEHTIRAYKKDLDSFSLFLEQESLTPVTLDRQRARRYLILMKTSSLQPRSIRRHLSALKSFFNFIVRQGFRPDNPFAHLSGVKTRKRLPSQLSYQDISTMMEQCPSDFWGLRDKLIIESLYSTGCRAFELVALDKQQVAGRKAVLIAGKGGKNRFVFFHQKASILLENYLSLKGKYENVLDPDSQRALFINTKGERLTTRGLFHIVKQYEKHLPIGKRVGVHIFRHSFATHILNEGADLRGVQELLGHSNLSTTQIYTHVGLDRLKEAYRQAHPHAKTTKQIKEQ